MATLAELKLIVDSSQLEHAKKVLDEFGVSASNVESSSERIGKGVSGSGESVDKFSNDVDTLTTRLTKMVENLNQGASSVLSFGGSVDSFGKSIAPLSTSMSDLVSTQKQYVEQQKATVDAQTKSINATDRMNAKLKEEVETMGMSRQEKLLYRAEQKGLTADNSEYVRSLQASIAAAKEEAAATKSAAQIKREAKAAEAELARQTREDIQKNIEASRNLQAVNSQLAAHEKQMAEQRKISLKKDEEIAELKAAQEGSRLLAEEKRKLAEQAKQNAVATQKEKDEFIKLRGEIDPVKGAYEKLYVQLEKIGNMRKKTTSSAQITELDELEATVHKNIKQLDTLGATTGKTAKEMAFAMRGLPAQFTDVVVSLQGGQKPLTVLLQQGGQIKDMFGGIVPAFKSMGGYALGLLTPLNLIIAGVGVLALGVYKGASQIEDLNKSIIRSGRIATVSSGQLLNYAEASSKSYGTIGSALPIISQLSAETSLAEDSIVNITSATLAWSAASGDAVGDIVKDFTSLGKEPVKAVEELNKKYKFLTVSLYENIRALEESGRSMDATKVASAALAEAIEDDARLMVLSLGTLSTAWHNIKSVASSAWDKITSLGRYNPEQLGVQAQLEYNKALEEYNHIMERKQEGYAIGIHGERLAKEALDEARKTLEAYNRAQERSLNQPVVDSLENINKSYEAVRDRVSKAEKALADFDAQSKAALSSDKMTNEGAIRAAEARAKLQREYNDAKREEAGIDLVSGAQASLDLAKQELETGEKISGAQQEYNNLNKEFEQIQRNINEGGLLSLTLDERRKYNNKEALLSIAKEKVEIEKANEARRTSLKITKSLGRDDAATKMLQAVVRQSEVLKEQLSIGRTLGAEEKKLIELKQRLSDLELKSKQGILTLDEQSILANKEALISQQQSNAELEKTIRLKKQADDLSKIQSGLDVTLSSSKNPEQLEGMGGLSDKEAERIKERISLRQEESRVILDLAQKETEAKGKNPEDAEFYAAQIELYKKHYADRLVNLDAYYAKEDQMRQSWKNGFKKSYKDYAETALDVSKQTEGFFSRTFTGLEDTMVTFLTTGKASFKDFAVSILADIARIATQMAIANALMAAFGGGGGVVAQADGGAWSGGVQMFAKGGAFTNTVVSKPTMFKTATGLGVMGEDGPEAILPLTRTSSGELGVKAVGGVDSGVINNNSVSAPVNVQVNVVNNSEGGGDKPSDAQNQGRDIQLAIKTECDKAIMNGLRTGGSIWKAINGR